MTRGITFVFSIHTGTTEDYTAEIGGNRMIAILKAEIGQAIKDEVNISLSVLSLLLLWS